MQRVCTYIKVTLLMGVLLAYVVHSGTGEGLRLSGSGTEGSSRGLMRKCEYVRDAESIYLINI